MKSNRLPIISMFFVLSILIMLLSGCPQGIQTEAKNSIAGTWVPVEITRNGEKVDYVALYVHFTEGGFWSYQWKWSSPFESNRKPEALEDYKAILDSYQCAFGTYTVKGDSAYFVGEVDIRPQFTNNKLTWFYKVSGDTLIFDNGTWHEVLVRQP